MSLPIDSVSDPSAKNAAPIDNATRLIEQI